VLQFLQGAGFVISCDLITWAIAESLAKKRVLSGHKWHNPVVEGQISGDPGGI